MKCCCRLASVEKEILSLKVDGRQSGWDLHMRRTKTSRKGQVWAVEPSLEV